MLKDLGEINSHDGEDKIVLASQTVLTRDPRFDGGSGSTDAFSVDSTVQFGP